MRCARRGPARKEQTNHYVNGSELSYFTFGATLQANTDQVHTQRKTIKKFRGFLVYISDPMFLETKKMG